MKCYLENYHNYVKNVSNDDLIDLYQHNKVAKNIKGRLHLWYVIQENRALRKIKPRITTKKKFHKQILHLKKTPAVRDIHQINGEILLKTKGKYPFVGVIYRAGGRMFHFKQSLLS